jgi:hypothetical protein
MGVNWSKDIDQTLTDRFQSRMSDWFGKLHDAIGSGE